MATYIANRPFLTARKRLARAGLNDSAAPGQLDLSDEAREQPRFVGRMFLPKRWRWAAPWAAGYFDVV
jgi:hypothetical protein